MIQAAVCLRIQYASVIDELHMTLIPAHTYMYVKWCRVHEIKAASKCDATLVSYSGILTPVWLAALT